MAKKTTIVNFVLDETGSMEVCWDATISGFNEYVGDLKKNKKNGPVKMTLTQFNSLKIETVLDHVSISDVPDLNRDTYRPDSTTPLYDAIAQTIKATEKRVKEYKKKPAVLCVIMTDGLENASKEYSRQMIFDLVEEKKKEGWTFAYLGANQDAWEVGQSIGVPVASSITYNSSPAGIRSAMAFAAEATSNYISNASMQSDSFFDGKKHVDEDTD